MTAILSKTLSVFGIFYSALSLIAMAVIVLDSTGVSLSVLGGPSSLMGLINGCHWWQCSEFWLVWPS